MLVTEEFWFGEIPGGVKKKIAVVHSISIPKRLRHNVVVGSEFSTNKKPTVIIPSEALK